MSQVTMPKMGEAMEEGTLIRWLKKEGEPVAENEAIAEVETEKASMEVPSYFSGVVKQLLIKEGETVPVNTPIAVVQVEGESAPETASVKRAAASPADGGAVNDPLRSTPGTETEGARAEAPTHEPARSSAPRQSDSPETGADDRVLASPLARKIASENQVDLHDVHGSGPKGRIVEADVRDFMDRVPEAAAPAASPIADPVRASASGHDRPMSRMRQIIARRLTESKQTIPHIYLVSEIDMGEARALIARLKSLEGDDRPRPTMTDLLVKASAHALKKYPQVNSQLNGNSIRVPDGIHVGVAVSIDEGLVVPVIRDAHAKTLFGIAEAARPLFDRARGGKLMPDDFAGGTFTISNLGMFDVESFVAIINPPQSAILAVGSILDQVVAVDGEVQIRPRMKVTLSADHRVVDGVLAAQFLQELKRLLQNPITLLE